jgi:hypothetical protein
MLKITHACTEKGLAELARFPSLGGFGQVDPLRWIIEVENIQRCKCWLRI